MPEPKPPCKGCEERHDLCWSDCEKFKQHKLEKEEYDSRRRSIIRADQDWVLATAFPKHIQRKFKRQ